MSPAQLSVWQEEQRLGALAMDFRRTRCQEERASIAKTYAEVVDRLILSGQWNEMPSFEDQLPDDWMPKAFYDFWLDDNDEH
jgi:hypothetical protein